MGCIGNWAEKISPVQSNSLAEKSSLRRTDLHRYDKRNQGQGDARAGKSWPSITGGHSSARPSAAQRSQVYTSGFFFSVITGHLAAISAFRAMYSRHCGGTFSSR